MSHPCKNLSRWQRSRTAVAATVTAAVTTAVTATVAAALLAVSSVHAAAAPAVTFVDGTARVQYSHTEGPARLVLKADGFDAAAMAKPDVLGAITDLTLPGPTSVLIGEHPPELNPHGSSPQLWLLALTVKDLPANTTQQRYLSITLAGQNFTVPYSLTNTAADKFVWTPRGPSALTIQPGGAIPVSISMGSVPASGVVVLRSDLVDKTSHLPISPSPLRACLSSPTACTDKSLHLSASEPAQLSLWGADRPGRFEGSVTLATPEKPDGDTISMTVYVSSLCYQLAGVATILAGVIFAWLVTVYIKNRLNRDQLLLPVSAILATVKALNDIIAAHPGTAPSVQAKLSDVATNLTIAKLETAGLPAKFPSPYPSTSAAAALDAYRLYAQTQSNWVSMVQVLVECGLKPSWAKSSANLNPAQQTILAAAITQIDALAQAPSPPDLNSLRSQLQVIQTKLVADLMAAAGPGLAAAAFAGSGQIASIPPPDQLRVEISILGITTWAFVTLVTSLAGAYILVFSGGAAGFGQPLDYLQCLLWGLGLSAGPQLLQSTTSSISTTFGVAR